MMTNSNAFSQWIDDNIGPDKRFSSNADMAAFLGISEASVRRVRNGHLPSLRILKAFAKLPEFEFHEIQQMIGLVGSYQEEPVPPEILTIVKDLKSLRETPLYHPALHAIQQVLVALMYKLDPPPPHD